jgi:hypothetical protein
MRGEKEPEPVLILRRFLFHKSFSKSGLKGVRNDHRRVVLSIPTMGDLATLKEWHTYPHNLRAQGCNAYGYDLDAYAEQLDEDSERLFVSGSRVCIKIIEFAAPRKLLQ